MRCLTRPPRNSAIYLFSITCFASARVCRREEWIDFNGDGVVDARDATTFGQMWNGTGGASGPWRGSQLPPKPE